MSRLRMLTTQQAAEYLGRNADEVKSMAASGRLPAVKAKNQWWFDVDELDAWATNNPRQTFKLSITEDELLERSEGRTYKELGDELGLTEQGIGYHLRKLGIRRRGNG